MQAETAAGPIRLESRVRRLHHRAIGFAVVIACAVVLAAAIVFWFVDVYVPAGELLEKNRKTLDRVPCSDQGCDVTAVAADFEFSGADYLVDKNTRFLLDSGPSDDLRLPLDRSDSSFIARFHEPETFVSPAGETWRLLSTEKRLSNYRIAILVGYPVEVSWRTNLPVSDFAAVDQQLREQVATIADLVRENNGVLEVRTTAIAKLPLDTYEIVDEKNGEILDGGLWLPIFLPADVVYPRDGISFALGKRKLYMSCVTGNERLIALSTHPIGDWTLLITVFPLLFLLAGLTAYISARTVLRCYLLFRQTKPIEVRDAVQTGEGPSVEFKRSISFEIPTSVYQVLQTVAAFANTGDGSVFIGIEDDGKLKGVPVQTLKAKDSVSHRLYHTIRERIRPTPSARIDFLETDGQTVCRVFVPRGDEPLYFLDGVIFVRHGTEDVKAQPELVRRILEEFAR